MTRQLQTRLQYARLKVDHGWQKQNLNEVENLYFRQLQRGQREARERERGKGSSKDPDEESVTTPTERGPRRRRGGKDGDAKSRNKGTIFVNMTKEGKTVDNPNAPKETAMDVDVETLAEPAKDPSSTNPNPNTVTNDTATVSPDEPLVDEPPGGIATMSSSQTQTRLSADSPDTPHPPSKLPATGTPNASQGSQTASTPGASIASPPLTYDSFWSSVSSQRPNLANLTSQLAGKGTAGTPSSSNAATGSGTGAGAASGYQGIQSLQSFQALQAFRAALANNAAEQRARTSGGGSQTRQKTSSSSANQSRKSSTPAQQDSAESSTDPEGTPKQS
ncbi:hypothetical protein SCHPADRAFT_260404 [Schizopora paradoxa]|uniref:Uncharacterized protein n=1 Tax=Schizopora paradoxa TaxID=27342 RepID=A0A0H2RVB9_9AGAM|nr:hypothetical protein SCHPADRAFT_260404 [Schizopora paradoxa]